jgi:hypothetical protein
MLGLSAAGGICLLPHTEREDDMTESVCKVLKGAHGRLALKPISGQLICHADAMPVDHLPALPTREKQDQHDDKGQDQPRRDYCDGSVAIARIPVLEFDNDRNDVAPGVQPGIIG